MQLTFLTDSLIFLKLNDIAKKKGIKLRLVDKKFFVYLLHLCESKGILDESNNLYFVRHSIITFSKDFGSSTSTIQSSLKALCSCDIVIRISYKREFKKNSSESYNVNTPYLTYVNHIILN